MILSMSAYPRIHSSTTRFQASLVLPHHPTTTLPPLASYSCPHRIQNTDPDFKAQTGPAPRYLGALITPTLHHAPSDCLTLLYWSHLLSRYEEAIHLDSSLIWQLGGGINVPMISKQYLLYFFQRACILSYYITFLQSF